MKSSPEAIDLLLTDGTRILRILRALEPGLGLQLNTAARFAKDVEAYRTADQAYQNARTLRLAELGPEQLRLDRAAKALISKTRNVLKPEFGSKWNERWINAGFRGKSITTPLSIGERITLLHRLGIFLSHSPKFEVAKLGATAANVNELRMKLTAIRETLKRHEELETQLSTTRKTTKTALRKRMRGLVNELVQLLADDDARWHTFGFVSPADRLSARRRRAANKKAAIRATEPASPDRISGEASVTGGAVLSA